MIEFGLIAAISALYMLGTVQGKTIADVIEREIPDDMELSPTARALIIWGWPLAAARALCVGAED